MGGRRTSGRGRGKENVREGWGEGERQGGVGGRRTSGRGGGKENVREG